MYVPKPRSLADDPSCCAPDAAETTPPPLTLWTPEAQTEDTARSGAETQAARVRTLVVDDDEIVRETFVSILREEGYEAHSAASALEALQLLERLPFDIMLCDIVMPGQNGMELLGQIVTAYPDLPVILVTGHASVDMARDALHRGASDFITKPCKAEDLPIVVERNLTRQAVQRKNALRYRMALQTSNESILDALLSALNTRDTETQGHSERVTAYTMEMADLMGLSSEQIYHIERGALLHDIGKIGIPDRILLKPGRLTRAEWIEMRKHPVIGYQMCARIEMLKRASQIVLHHHEAWDGTGYPDGLTGEAIPLGARIFAIADTLDAITSDRPYRAAMPFRAAREEIIKYSGRQFDPEIVQVFLSVPESRWQHIRSLADK
ncbi:MAG TPA: HD domain-containing phosphohydrolase [Chthonomonadaceae bacterium]|nr:HD domain-containing phosphohydrolase [Chthonomonadaceae bacterium]